MATRIVLIRAVNVGGAKLPMAELREVATGLGASEVSTYIASGNLLCTLPGDPAEFDRALEKAIQERYGFFREVISRSDTDLEAALAAHPFDIVEPEYSYVYALTGTPATTAVNEFATKDFGADVFEVIDDNLHIRYDAGAGTSKLTAPVIAKGLGVQGTGRNLRTVQKLIELARA